MSELENSKLENEEALEEGISLVDIMKMVFFKKRIITIVTCSVFIICFLLIMLFYNNRVPTYETKFEYTYPTLDNNKYFDGSKFNYRDLISFDALEKLKNSNSDFESIDIEKMYDNDDINISYVDNTTDKSVEKEIVYTISIKKSYFTSSKQAKLFISELASAPDRYNIVLSKKVSYDNYLKLYDDANKYETMVDMLNSQYNLINNKYAELISLFGDVILENGNLISTYKTNLEAYFYNNSMDNLYDEIKLNGYIIKNDSYINELNVRKNTLLKEKTINQAKLDDFETKVDQILASNSATSTIIIDNYTKEIVRLVNEIYEIDKEIAEIDAKLNSTVNTTSFDARLFVFRTKLEEFANELSDVEKELVKINSNTIFQYNSVIRENGSISIILAGIGSLVVGLVVGGITNVCLYFVIKSKKKEEEN